MLEVLGDTSAMEARDLEAYQVIETTPRRVDVHGFGVLARGDDLDDVLGTMRRAAAAMTGDPAHHTGAPPGRWSPALRAPDRRSETTNLVAADAEGNVCAVTTSLGLGSGVWVPGFGVHLNSMLGEGELIRDGVGPGMRMGSMMSPMLAIDPSGRPVGGGRRGRAAAGSVRRWCSAMLRMLDAHPAAGRDRGAPAERRTGGWSGWSPASPPRWCRPWPRTVTRWRSPTDADPYFGGVSGPQLARRRCRPAARRSR